MEEKKAQEEQQQSKQPPSSKSKVTLDDFDQGVVRRTIASMYSLKKVLSTLDNIRTSIGYTGSKGRLRKDLLHVKFAYTRCGLNQKVLMERQDVVLSRIRYLRMVRELREAGYTDEWERSGSVVECLTRDRRAAGSSLTGVTALWSLSKTHLS